MGTLLLVILKECIADLNFHLLPELRLRLDVVHLAVPEAQP